MPTYEYACRSCEERLEVVQSFTDEPLTVCESCGGELRKVFSAAGLIFKGSGWHIKDYSSAGKGSSGSGSVSDAASAATSDTKDSSSAKPAPAAPSSSTPSSAPSSTD